MPACNVGMTAAASDDSWNECCLVDRTNELSILPGWLLCCYK